MSVGGNFHNPQWPKNQVDWVCANFRQCASFALMVDAFNEVFHTHRSRNAMIGKCDRLGLHDPGQGPKPTRHYPPRRPRGPRKQYKRSSRAAMQMQPRLESKYDCAWPGDFPCICKASIGPYCEVHAKLAYRQMPTERRIKQLMYYH